MPATIVFASTHSVIDFTSGAAIATGRALELLDGLGFSCQAFCGSRLDAPGEMLFEELLAARGSRYESRNATIGRHEARMTFTFQGRVPVTVVQTASTRGRWSAMAEAEARYTPETREAPTAEEVRPWVETIGRLWDDAQTYRRASRAAAERATVWSPERLAPVYRDFFQNVRPQPAAPVVPKEVKSEE